MATKEPVLARRRRLAATDALAEGYTDKAIAEAGPRRVNGTACDSGAYASGELWDALSPEERHRVLCRAVLLTAHPSSRRCRHVSSAIESGCRDLGLRPRRGPPDAHGRQVAAGERTESVHHRGRLSEDEVIVRNGVRGDAAPRAVAETCTIAGRRGRR